MNHVCQKCFVGFHYIMLIKRKIFICLKCSNKVTEKTILKYADFNSKIKHLIVVYLELNDFLNYSFN